MNFDHESKEIQVLESTFRYDDGFMGACGSRFYPVSREEYEERTNDREGLIEWLKDCTREPAFGSFEKWADAIIASGETGSILYDLSYSEHWDSIREEVGMTEDEAYIFDCVGGGRMFSADYQGNMNPDLCQIIRNYES